MIASANENLNQCLKVTSFDRTASSRYKKAEEFDKEYKYLKKKWEKWAKCHIYGGLA